MGGHDIPGMPSPRPIEKIRQPARDAVSERQLIAEIKAMSLEELLNDHTAVMRRNKCLIR